MLRNAEIGNQDKERFFFESYKIIKNDIIVFENQMTETRNLVFFAVYR